MRMLSLYFAFLFLPLLLNLTLRLLVFLKTVYSLKDYAS